MISLVIVIILVLLDILSKLFIMGTLNPGQDHGILGSFVTLTNDKANIAVFDFFEMRTFILLLTAIAYLVIMTVFSDKFNVSQFKRHKIYFSIYIAGVIAVLVDRLFYSYAPSILEIDTMFFSTLIDLSMIYVSIGMILPILCIVKRSSKLTNELTKLNMNEKK